MAERSTTVEKVIVDIATILRIQKHATDAPGDDKSGQLLGFYNEATKTLEVSQSFAVPADIADQRTFEDEMMRKYRTLQNPLAKVGWYQICWGQEYILSLIVQMNYQLSIPNAIFLVYDQSSQRRGAKTSFRAFQTSSKLNLLRNTNNGADLADALTSINLNKDQLLIEIPVEIARSPIADALFCEYRSAVEKVVAQPRQYDLTRSYRSNLGELVEAIDENIDCQTKLVELNIRNANQNALAAAEDPILDYLASHARLTEVNKKVKALGSYSLESSLILGDLLSSQK